MIGNDFKIYLCVNFDRFEAFTTVMAEMIPDRPGGAVNMIAG